MNCWNLKKLYNEYLASLNDTLEDKYFWVRKLTGDITT